MKDEPLILRPLKAMRAKCLDCCCGQYKEVALCTVTSCAIWPYRLGRRPSTVQRKNTTCVAGFQRAGAIP